MKTSAKFVMLEEQTALSTSKVSKPASAGIAQPTGKKDPMGNGGSHSTMVPFNIDYEALEKLIKSSEEAREELESTPGYMRCPDCGCMLSVGGIDLGYGDYQEVLYCEGNCGYEEYV